MSLMNDCGRGLLVTGTDTGIGKTWVAAMIARELVATGRSVGVFKPACSGAELSADGQWSWPDLDTLMSSVPGSRIDDVCPYRLMAPLAPPVSARQAGVSIDFETMLRCARQQLQRHEFVVIEGVGGWLCPLTDQHSIADFAQQINVPVVIVARLGLGTINHTLLTAESILRKGVPLAGVILNDVDDESRTLAASTNPDELSQRLRLLSSEFGMKAAIPVLGIVHYRGNSVCLSGTDQPARIEWMQLALPT